MSQQLEHNQLSAGAGTFSHIERTTWQPAQPDGWKLPVIEQCAQSLARAGVATIAYGVLSALVGSDWRGFGLAVVIGLGVGLYDFQRGIGTLFETYRLQELHTEIYEKEATAAAAASHSTVTVELQQPKENGYTPIDYDQFSTDIDTLTRACEVDLVSKRQFQAAGIGGDVAMRLVAELLELSYAWRPVENEPAIWTLKGMALRYQLLANAGGGLVVEAPHQ